MAGKQADIKVGVITNYDDKGLKQAEGGLKGFKASIADADGVGGKFKAGWSSATDSIKANAGGLAMAGGAALVAFGVKAVGAFTDTAKAALDLGTSTGLSVEEASRWIAVGDDFEVSAQALATGLGKVSKTLDDTKWKKYGIETRDASGEARSANDIMIDAFDTLSKVTNETERARIGQELFGKGYQSLTPILGHTREEYEKMLGAVEKGQVITDKEAAKAERFRLAQDQLSDAFKDIQISIGGVVADLAPMIEQTSKTVTQLGELVAVADEATESIGGLGNVVMAAGNPLAAMNVVQSALTDVVDESNMSLKELQDNYTKAGADASTLAIVTNRWYEQHKVLNPALQETERETRRLAGSMETLEESTDETTATVDALTQSLIDTEFAYDKLTGKLDEQDAWAHVQESIMAFAANTEATAQDVRDLTRDLADYINETALIPAEKKTLFLAELDEGKLEEVQRRLEIFARNNQVNVNLILAGAPGFDGGLRGKRASGGHVSNGAWLVGEEGPEVLQMNGVSGNIIPNPQLLWDGGGQGNGVGGTTINVHGGLGTNGYELAKVIVNLLAEYDRRNGTVITRGRGR